MLSLIATPRVIKVSWLILESMFEKYITARLVWVFLISVSVSFSLAASVRVISFAVLTVEVYSLLFSIFVICFY